MGDDKPIIKNYYINMGQQEGLKEGTLLNVYRDKIVQNPFAIDKNTTFKIKIGELRVIHTESNNSIAVVHQQRAFDDPNYAIHHFNRKIRIGDKVFVQIE